MKVQIKQYKKGSYIYLEQNNAPKEFYILKKGEIRIVTTHPILGTEKTETRTQGHIFGIIQCITQISERERVEALTDCEVIAVGKNQIQQLFRESPKVIMKILSEYSEILRGLDNLLLEKDLILNFMKREEVIFELTRQYLLNSQENKASHLLQSYLLEKPDNMELIRKAQLMLKDLPKVVVHKAQGLFENHIYETDEIIFTEMEQADSFYLVRRGQVKISNIRDGKETILAILSEGAIFGEMAILNNKPRNATAVANSNCEVSIIHKKYINQLPPSLFENILEHLTSRIWNTLQTLYSMELTNPVARVYFFLALKLREKLKGSDLINGTNSYVFRSSLEELYNMAHIKSLNSKLLAEFEQDPNVVITKNSVRIKNIKAFIDKSYFLVSRDSGKARNVN